MNASEALLKIEGAIKAFPQQRSGWMESISIQLNYCANLLRGSVGAERVKEINMATWRFVNLMATISAL
jgi:hypothetical protein